MIITDCLFWAFQNVHIPENTTHTEFVLIFQIGTITPLHYQHCHRICSILKYIGNIKLTGHMRNLAVSYVRAIDPYVKATVYSFKVQKRFWRFLISTVLKSMHIGSTRNVLWHIWWIKRKWIPDVCILVCIISSHLPYTWNLNLIKIFCIIILLKERILNVIDAVKILEFPSSIQ